MKIELLTNDSFHIFLNNNYFDDLDLSDKDKIIEVVRDLIKQIKDKLNMKGFYKVKVYVSSKLGLFLDILKIEDIDFSNNIDLRVIVSLNEKVLFETVMYEVLPNNINVKYLNNKFYINVDDVSNIYSILEYGRFIYGDEVSKILKQSHYL